jgi:hypothetical protein
MYSEMPSIETESCLQKYVPALTLSQKCPTYCNPEILANIYVSVWFGSLFREHRLSFLSGILYPVYQSSEYLNGRQLKVASFL